VAANTAILGRCSQKIAGGQGRDPKREEDILRTQLEKREIPSLNGLRGLAALAVVVWHYLDAWKLTYLFPGPFAVTLFFELSGLLITSLILQEVERTAGFDRGRFYARRALRLFPAFYVVWLLCRVAGPFPGSWAYFFYLGDYYTALGGSYSVLTAAWSLGVEEKFYLLWPLLLVRVKQRYLVRGLTAVLLLEPVYRAILSNIGLRTYTWFAFDARLDPIVLGCLIALLVRRGWSAPRWLRHPATAPAALVLIFVFQRFSDAVTYLLAVLLLSVICRPPVLLNNAVTRYLGSISYSLYLIHGYAHGVLWPPLSALVGTSAMLPVLAMQVGLALGTASLLHFGVERPFLRWKDRLHRRVMPAHGEG
jgi:peptidoglycan/LPS O-acetylase OafA/YrhL